jgi:hypothetical protein
VVAVVDHLKNEAFDRAGSQRDEAGEANSSLFAVNNASKVTANAAAF